VKGNKELKIKEQEIEWLSDVDMISLGQTMVLAYTQLVDEMDNYFYSGELSREEVKEFITEHLMYFKKVYEELNERFKGYLEKIKS
jgi:polyhydroxyalkanoate synthesis regulator phasin